MNGNEQARNAEISAHRDTTFFEYIKTKRKESPSGGERSPFLVPPWTSVVFRSCRQHL